MQPIALTIEAVNRSGHRAAQLGDVDRGADAICVTQFPDKFIACGW
jgi:hypothetical protein